MIVDLGVESHPHLAGHRVQGVVVLPGSAYLDLVLRAAVEAIGERPFVVEHIRFERAFVLPARGTRALDVTVAQNSDGDWECTATGVATGIRHATARFGHGSPDGPPDRIVRSGGVEINGDELYARMAAAGNDFGPEFRGVRRCRTGDGWAVGELRAGHGSLDAAMQVLCAATFSAATDATPLVLAGVDRVRLHDRPGRRVFAVLCGDLVGDVLIVDDEGCPAVELTGVRLRALPSATTTVGVAATFAARPLSDALSFWFDLIGTPATIEFAPDGQVFQQLLDPAGLLATNTDGVNVVLVRPHDLIRAPDLGEIAQVLPYEAEYLYDEIFVRQVYARHGVDLPDGACVFDVGANIGMFTLWAQGRCPDARIFAFEPAPEVFEVLRSNVGGKATLFDCGLGAQDGERLFTFYPNSTVFSGFAADPARDGTAVETVVRNVLRTSVSDEKVEPLVDRFTRDRLESETQLRPMRTISGVITEHAVDCVDLLKIDAEHGEVDVLRGIDDEHWPRIRQVVAEVHDASDTVRELLEQHGFEVVVDDHDELLRGTGFVHVYARRPGAEPALDPGCADLVSAFETFGRPCIVVLFAPAGDSRFAGELAALPNTSVITVDGVPSRGAVPYTRDFYTELATRIVRRHLALSHAPAKVLALDCDNTLWTGVCGEGGVHVDEYRRALQEFVVAEQEAGTLICLCSKNAPADVHDVFAHRTDMPLALRHVIAQRIGWTAKSVGLTEIAEELGIALSDVVLLDDDPVECAEVRANVPGVLTLRVPSDPARIPAFLERIWVFDRIEVTDEDRVRTERYRQERRRGAWRAESMSFASFISGLDLRVSISPCREADRPRVTQLIGRVAQFTTGVVSDWQACSPPNHSRAVRVEDRFGDYGLVGLIAAGPADGVLTVDAFLLSCRALGRGVEHRMLAALGDLAREHGYDGIAFPFWSTGRNEPARRFLESVAGPLRDGVFTMSAEVAARAVFTPPESEPVLWSAPAAPGRTDREAYRHIAELESVPDAVDARLTRKRPTLRTAFAGPDDEIERTLAGVWQRVLGIEEVGVDDNFFELGGTSLRAAQVIAELSDLVGAAMPDIGVFEGSTIRALAALIREPDTSGVTGRSRGERRRARQRVR